jgi:regulator of extracellular matrix RemA (YlzA/DUF370 family)
MTKLLVNNTYGEKTLSIIQKNCIITAVQNEKMTKMTKRIADVVVAVSAEV